MVTRLAHVPGSWTGMACAVALLFAASTTVPPVPAQPGKPAAVKARKTIDTVALPKLGSIHLQGADDDEALISDFSAFGIDERGEFGFLKGCGCDRVFVLVDRDGKLVRKIRCPSHSMYARPSAGRSGLAAIAGWWLLPMIATRASPAHNGSMPRPGR